MQSELKRLSRARPSSSKDDRRRSERFPIKLEARYKIIGRPNISGIGKTINMSGRGVLFTTEYVLAERQSIELAVCWPAKLNDTIPLQLVALGHVVRAEETQAAITIEQYEFKTCSSELFNGKAVRFLGASRDRDPKQVAIGSESRTAKPYLTT
jgi:hypothetical protein